VIMADTDDCGCCCGTATDTPAVKFNRPGLPAIAYRIGTHGKFKASVAARLSSTDFPVLSGLTTRNDADYTVALCDAFATMADVLTFYSERIANEAYLRTATERRSVLELARLIGYQLAPGVAAGTALAFTLQDAPGQPSQAAQPVTIPVGTRVMSVPDPGQDAQTFETVAAITARVSWNAIPAQQSEPVRHWAHRTELHLAGSNTQLQKGDAILIIGAENDDGLTNDRWDIRWLSEVEVDVTGNVTRIVWPNRLDNKWAANPAHGIHVYALRQRAALFGHNAPKPQLIFNTNNPDSNNLTNGSTGSGMEWAGFTIDVANRHINLDASYPKIVPGSWFALTGGLLHRFPHPVWAFTALYRAIRVADLSRSDYGLSGKITRLTADRKKKLSRFVLRRTSVLAQSEELTPVGRPLVYPVYGGSLALDGLEGDLAPGQLIAVSGKRQRVVVGLNTSLVSFPDDPARTAVAGESFVMLAAPEQLVGGGTQVVAPEQLDPQASPPLAGTLRWHLGDADGNAVTVEAPVGRLHLQPADKGDKAVSEVCTIANAADAVTSDADRTTLKLALALTHCYDRSTVAANANVAPATHGETVSEIAGAGDASRANQSFQLKQAPPTYTSTTTDPSGRASTLQARVNDLLWSEVPSLYGRGPRERVYTLRQDDNGKTTIRFGDGIEGARLPSAQNNVRLTYRKGIGRAGNLRDGQLTNLLTRPLGVQGVTNSGAATGGQDPEVLADARKNAPLRTLTLERAVSIEDYANFSRTFAGIAKAYATWIGAGHARGIHITVAGPDAGAVSADTHDNLVGALRRYGDPLLPLSVSSFAAATFRLKAGVKVAGDADHDQVLAAVVAALRAAYSFEARDFGQPVTIDELYATLQSVSGVVATDITELHRSDAGIAPPQPAPRLFATLPTVADDGSVSAAELLTLDPAPLDLGAMP